MNTTTLIRPYLACALWSSTDDNGEPLDKRFSVEDVDAASVVRAKKAIDGFLAECAEEKLEIWRLTDEQVGHDLWLTRNGHGAGFWDRGLGELGARLTEVAKALGTSDAYVGDDGKVHLT